MTRKNSRTCIFCYNVISEQNERIDCVFGNGCRLCEPCHRALEMEAAREGLRMHAEWVRQRNNAGLSV